MKREIITFFPETTRFSSLKKSTAEQTKTQKSTLLKLVIATICAFLCGTASQASALLFFSEAFTAEQQTTKPKQDFSALKAQQKKRYQAINFQQNIANMANKLIENIEDPDPYTGQLADGVTATVFVDLKKMTRTSSFGRYLAEQLMSELQQKGYPVREIRKSTTILVQPQRGEYGLSRDVEEISPSLQARTMLTGTYTVAGDQIMVNAKIIDNMDATLLSSATFLFDKNELAGILLSDAASAHAKKNEYVYMKKLEL